MTEIDVPDWVVVKFIDELGKAAGYPPYVNATIQRHFKDALTAALGAWVGPELDEYQRMRDGVGGCTDGGCVIKRPTGMHTNGGCKCWQDKIKAQRMMRAGQKLFDTLRQEKPE